MNSTVPSKPRHVPAAQGCCSHRNPHGCSPPGLCSAQPTWPYTAAPLLSAREVTVISCAPGVCQAPDYVHQTTPQKGPPKICVWSSSFASRPARSHGIFWSVAFCLGEQLRFFKSLPSPRNQPNSLRCPHLSSGPAGTKTTPSAPVSPSTRCTKRLTGPPRHLSLFCLDNCIVKNYLSYI